MECVSPTKVAAILKSAIQQSSENLSELRVLDLGAGNGMMGEELKKQGIARLIGVDIIPEAYMRPRYVTGLACTMPIT